jgi:hypothetical protein
MTVVENHPRNFASPVKTNTACHEIESLSTLLESNCDGFEKFFKAISSKKHDKYHLFSDPKKKI